MKIDLLPYANLKRIHKGALQALEHFLYELNTYTRFLENPPEPERLTDYREKVWELLHHIIFLERSNGLVSYELPFKEGVKPVTIKEGLELLEATILKQLKRMRHVSIGFVGRYGSGKTNTKLLLQEYLSRRGEQDYSVKAITGDLFGATQFDIEEAKRGKERSVILVEAPQIEPRESVDKLVLVTLSEGIRIKRLLGRDNMKVYDPLVELANGLLSKYSIDSQRPYADIVINNGHNFRDLVR